jgi:hypothetical protein
MIPKNGGGDIVAGLGKKDEFCLVGGRRGRKVEFVDVDMIRMRSHSYERSTFTWALDVQQMIG